MDDLEALAADIHRQLKPQTTLISDTVRIAEIISKGKYREHLPFWQLLGLSIILYKS